MGKPKFMILGAQRAGTTSLAAYLDRHPQVSMPNSKKEVCFKSNEPVRFMINDKDLFVPPKRFVLSFIKNGINKEPSYFNRLYDFISIDEYWSLFDDDLIGFDASPDYFDNPKVPKRIAKILPNIKFIILLRNPITRAWSHYWHEVKNNGTEYLPFEKAIERPLLNDYDWYFFSYLQRGWYAQHLKRWFSYFPKENFRIILSEHFFTNPKEVFIKIQQWLGLDPIIFLNEYPKFNSINPPPIPDNIKNLLAEYYLPFQKQLEELLSEN